MKENRWFNNKTKLRRILWNIWKETTACIITITLSTPISCLILISIIPLAFLCFSFMGEKRDKTGTLSHYPQIPRCITILNFTVYTTFHSQTKYFRVYNINRGAPYSTVYLSFSTLNFQISSFQPRISFFR